MATTFAQVQNRVRSYLLGFSLDQEQVSSLQSSMTSSDTTFTVDPSTVNSVSRGLCQIDDELILVKMADQTSGLVTVMGGINGRGREGSTPAAHSANALVTNSPAYPNIRIQEAINDTLLGVYPHLVTFGTTNIQKHAPQVEYALPADCLDVWYVTGQLVGPSLVWQPLPNWRYNPYADTSVFPSGKSIEILDAVVPGRQQRVVYAKKINTLTNASDDFETVSGLPERCVDMVSYGAVARLLPAYEAARLQQRTIEANQRSSLVPPASATRTSQYYLALYQQRLAEERQRMYTEIPNYQQYQGS
jgi:hypothetical protein